MEEMLQNYQKGPSAMNGNPWTNSSGQTQQCMEHRCDHMHQKISAKFGEKFKFIPAQKIFCWVQIYFFPPFYTENWWRPSLDPEFWVSKRVKEQNIGIFMKPKVSFSNVIYKTFNRMLIFMLKSWYEKKISHILGLKKKKVTQQKVGENFYSI